MLAGVELLSRPDPGYLEVVEPQIVKVRLREHVPPGWRGPVLARPWPEGYTAGEMRDGWLAWQAAGGLPSGTIGYEFANEPNLAQHGIDPSAWHAEAVEFLAWYRGQGGPRVLLTPGLQPHTRTWEWIDVLADLEGRFADVVVGRGVHAYWRRLEGIGSGLGVLAECLRGLRPGLLAFLTEFGDSSFERDASPRTYVPERVEACCRFLERVAAGGRIAAATLFIGTGNGDPAWHGHDEHGGFLFGWEDQRRIMDAGRGSVLPPSPEEPVPGPGGGGGTMNRPNDSEAHHIWNDAYALDPGDLDSPGYNPAARLQQILPPGAIPLTAERRVGRWLYLITTGGVAIVEDGNWGNAWFARTRAEVQAVPR